jgi:hypothetical protein
MIGIRDKRGLARKESRLPRVEDISSTMPIPIFSRKRATTPPQRAPVVGKISAVLKSWVKFCSHGR